jgi:hypothetical protein
MYFSVMNLILSYSSHRYVSTTHVVIFRVVSVRIQIYIYSVSGSLHSYNHRILVKVPVKGETVHCANCTNAHQYGSRSTTYTCYVHHCTEPQSRQPFMTCNILYPSLFSFNRYFSKKSFYFNRKLIAIFYKYICILALITMKMATLVTETCLWSL